MYLLYNTNFFIIKIKNFSTLEDALRELQIDTISRSSDYNSNIYVIHENEPNIIYTSDGNYIYLSNLAFKTQKKIFTNKRAFYNGKQYWGLYSSSELDKNLYFADKMNITINEKKIKNIKFEDDLNNESVIEDITQPINNELPNTNIDVNTNIDKNVNIDVDVEKEKKINQIIKMIEDVNDLYQKELSNIKKLELNLKTYDTKLKKLEKTKKDNIINDIIRTQSEYRTWKKIKYGLKDDSDESDILKPIEELELTDSIVPILFLSKYNYIDKIQNNESIRKILDEINKLNLNDLYTDDSLPNENIIQFCNKYMKLSKELHYHFNDHEWNYLENEMNLNSTNKLGTNIINSKKI